MLAREVAVAMGISLSYAADLISDPAGTKARARKESYQGTCEFCGAGTSGSNGRSAAPSICGSCDLARRHDERYWTSERITGAIQRFVRENGRPPIAPEWNVSERAEWAPHMNTVQAEFGSWANAIEASGSARPSVGQYQLVDRAVVARASGFKRRKFDHDEARALFAAGVSRSELQRRYSVSSTAIFRATSETADVERAAA